MNYRGQLAWTLQKVNVMGKNGSKLFWFKRDKDQVQYVKFNIFKYTYLWKAFGNNWKTFNMEWISNNVKILKIFLNIIMASGLSRILRSCMMKYIKEGSFIYLQMTFEYFSKKTNLYMYIGKYFKIW